MKKHVVNNSPVVLGFALISLGVLILGQFTGGKSTSLLFTCYRSSFSDPLFYVRLFTHVLGHASLSHYVNNMMMFLLIGPILEEKYGSKRLLEIICVVALITGVVHVTISGNTGLLGASGVVFAFIILASVTGTTRKNEIPVTMIIVAALYIGSEIYTGITTSDNVSQITHIIGGSVGAIYGLSVHPRR